MRSALLAFLLLFACCLAGCAQDSRLHGKWKFDREYTESQLPHEQTASSKGNALQNMKEELAATLIPSLIEQLEGSRMIVTRKEMIFTTRDGTGKARTYDVIERPTADSWLIKTADGDVETYSREGERLVSPASGDVHFKVYYKPDN